MEHNMETSNDNVIPMAPEQSAQQAATTPQLSVSDLSAAVNIIDVVSRRGAFEGAELSDVGALRARLIAFLKATEALAVAAKKQENPVQE